MSWGGVGEVELEGWSWRGGVRWMRSVRPKVKEMFELGMAPSYFQEMDFQFLYWLQVVGKLT